MVLYIRRANCIYAMNETEFYERRINMDKAIGCCDSILELMQYAGETLPVDAQKYMRFVEKILLEKKLIKGWRKSDNRLLRKIKEEQ